MRIPIATVIVLTTLLVSAPVAVRAQDLDAPGLYQRNCAQCHDAGINRAPQRDAFLSMSPERVLAAMETGAMVTMANNRTAAERRAIAEFLTGKKFGSALNTTPSAAAMCRLQNQSFDPAAGPRWTAWGSNSSNTRFQDAAAARLTAADIPATDKGRQDLLFRERALTLFLTGHRVGDLRRLIYQYTRNAETVFPTGPYQEGNPDKQGTNYGTDVNLPIPQEEQNNPQFPGGQCINRSAGMS